MKTAARLTTLQTAATVIARLLIVAAAYSAVAQVGLLLALVRDQVTPLWPATGVALVFLYRWGLSVAPGITLGAVLVNLPIASTLWSVAMISAGNTLAPVCAYLLLRATGFRSQLDRLKDALLLVFLGAFTGMAISSTAGSLALLWSDAISADRFCAVWLVWWTGDALGVLVVVPLTLTALTLLSGRLPWRDHPWRWVEAGALLACTIGVGVFITTTSLRLLFLVFPFLIWAALRFQLVGAAPCALIVSVLAIVAAAHEYGPFAQIGLVERMVILQAFNGSVALTALLLAVVTTERNEARKAIERACTQLAAAVATLPPGAVLLQGSLRKMVKEARSRTQEEVHRNGSDPSSTCPARHSARR
ncbi:Integral membrane sensor domain MASE1 [Allokutzneria albata]|uniref:Integral membrane sensor domain MASE1 n=1 Tax=Allokutzneria albata TaxID=211114 RepID=A0A1G9SF71_ALLAB|nr:Integral membrane sensor domain MASE1 [Allokutzneria albata]